MCSGLPVEIPVCQGVGDLVQVTSPLCATVPDPQSGPNGSYLPLRATVGIDYHMESAWHVVNTQKRVTFIMLNQEFVWRWPLHCTLKCERKMGILAPFP